MIAEFSAVPHFSGSQGGLTPSPFVLAHPSCQECDHFFRESTCIKNYRMQKEPLFSDLTVSSHLNSFNLNSKNWLTCNFSLRYLYIIHDTVDENTQRYQVEVVNLIEYWILKTNFQGKSVAARGENSPLDHGRQRVNNTRRCNTVMKTLAVFHPIGSQRNTMLILIIIITIIIIIIFNEGTQFATAVFSGALILLRRKLCPRGSSRRWRRVNYMATIDCKTLDETNSLSADNVSYKRRFEKIISEPIISELSDLSFEVQSVLQQDGHG